MSFSGFAVPSFPSLSPAAHSTDAMIALLIELITQLVRAFTLYIQSTSVTPASLPRSPPRKSSTPRHPFVCTYCSDAKHLIKACPLVSSDIRAGLCQRNPRGRVVLPSGLYVPHSVPGPNLRNCIVTYLRQSLHVTRSATSTSLAAAVHHAIPPSPLSSNSAVRRGVPTATAPSASPRTSPSNTVDPDEARIAEIEREIITLHARHAAANSASKPSASPRTSPSNTVDPDEARIAEIEHEITMLRARCAAADSAPKPLLPRSATSSTSAPLPSMFNTLPNSSPSPPISFNSAFAPQDNSVMVTAAQCSRTRLHSP